VDPNQNPSRPFYIHPSESPSSVVVSPPLSANNFQSWSRSFQMALISKNKMGFLNGNILIPATTDPLYPFWERCNTMLMSWILNSLSPSIPFLLQSLKVLYFSNELLMSRLIFASIFLKEICFASLSYRKKSILPNKVRSLSPTSTPI
ncbi:hypothetical protein V8G54_022361, partial [Vigna mungo]